MNQKFTKKLEDIPVQAQTFYMVLSEYSLEELETAFLSHLRGSSEYPTPACISKLVRADTELCQSVYIQFTKWLDVNKDAGWSIGKSEKLKYVKAYEEKQVVKLEPKVGWESAEGVQDLLNKVKRLEG